MSKKRIFITAHYMEIGGAETALVGLLNALDPERVDVDFFICDHHGPMMQFIPDWINVLPPVPAYTMLERPIKEVVRKGFWGIAFSRLYGKVKSKVLYKLSGSKLPNMSVFGYTDQMVRHFMPMINTTKEYDLALNFIGPGYIVTDKIRAKKTAGWIHSDYTKQWVGRDTKSYKGDTTYIISISEDVTKTFLQVYPLCASKIVLIENILSPAFVRKRADLQDVSAELGGGKCLNIITIGRFCEQKNLENVPTICRKTIDNMIKLLPVGRFSEAKNYDNVHAIAKALIEHLQVSGEGLAVSASSEKISNPGTLNSNPELKWYLIGYGGMESLIREKIAEAGMEKHVIILGKKENPYPYIKACDIYVQPSRYEGKSVTVREAQMLCKPVVVTNYPTASSQIKSGIDGVIVPMDNEGCAKGLADVILDKTLQESIIEHLKVNDYGNEGEVEKIYALMG